MRAKRSWTSTRARPPLMLVSSPPPRRSALRDHPLWHARHLGRRVGQQHWRKLLKATLAEEENTDKALSDLAEGAVNQAAEDGLTNQQQRGPRAEARGLFTSHKTLGEAGALPVQASRAGTSVTTAVVCRREVLVASGRSLLRLKPQLVDAFAAMKLHHSRHQ